MEELHETGQQAVESMVRMADFADEEEADRVVQLAKQKEQLARKQDTARLEDTAQRLELVQQESASRLEEQEVARTEQLSTGLQSRLLVHQPRPSLRAPHPPAGGV